MSVISSIISSFSEEFRQVVFDQQGASEHAQYLSNRPAKLEVVLDDCNEAVRDDGDMNLYPDSILRVTPERFDLEMLLDPFEEKFHLPAIAVKQGSLLGREIKVIGIEHKRASEVFCIIDNPSHICWVVPCVPIPREPYCLVKEYAVRSIKNVFPADDFEFRFPFLADDEECAAEMYSEKPCEVETPTVKDIAGVGFVVNLRAGAG